MTVIKMIKMWSKRYCYAVTEIIKKKGLVKLVQYCTICQCAANLTTSSNFTTILVFLYSSGVIAVKKIVSFFSRFKIFFGLTDVSTNRPKCSCF